MLTFKESRHAGLKIILLSVVGVLLIVIVGVAYALFSSQTVQAQLHVESGTVLVNGKDVSDNVVLNRGDVVETKDGLGTVILYESILVSLQPNTKITLDDLTKQHPRIKQEGGITWNKFAHLAGIDEFSIRTSSSVASVRGTSFELSENKIMTAEGEVAYSLDGEDFTVSELDVVEKKDNKINKRTVNPEEMATVKKHFERVIKEMQYMRSREINKHSTMMNFIKNRYSVSDEQIDHSLDDADHGRTDIDKLVEKSLVRPQALKKMTDITKEIKKMNEELGTLTERVAKKQQEEQHHQGDAQNKNDVNEKNAVSGDHVKKKNGKPDSENSGEQKQPSSMKRGDVREFFRATNNEIAPAANVGITAHAVLETRLKKSSGASSSSELSHGSSSQGRVLHANSGERSSGSSHSSTSSGGGSHSSSRGVAEVLLVGVVVRGIAAAEAVEVVVAVTLAVQRVKNNFV